MLTLSEIKDYIKKNYLEDDIPKGFEPDCDSVNEAVDARALASYKHRLGICKNNPFKKWFYLGKGKDKEHNVYCRNTMFDDFRRKSFNKWRKKIERKGVNIVRPYFDNDKHVHNYKIFRYFDYQYSNIWNRIKYGFQYSPNCSIWDMTDLMDYLIVKLTVMGVYHGAAFSHVLYHKQKMHTIWQARKMLIEAVSAEEVYTYAKSLELKEQFHLDKDYFDLVDTWSPNDFIKSGKVSKKNWMDDDDFNYSVNPENLTGFFDKELYNTEEGRTQIVKKCKEIDDYWFSLDKDSESDFYYLAIFTNIKIREAFEFISSHFYEWGD